MKQIPIIRPDDEENWTKIIEKQMAKILIEIEEMTYEHQQMEEFAKRRKFHDAAEHQQRTKLEILDVLTAVYGLAYRAGIEQEIWDAHKQKMEGYQSDPTRMYEIIGWVELVEKE